MLFRNYIVIFIFFMVSFLIFPQINGYFFYGELCENCRDDEIRFNSILREKLPAAKRNKYSCNFYIYNIYEITGRSIYESITDDLGIDRRQLEMPLVILNGKILQGYDNIIANIREIFFNAVDQMH